MYHAILACHDSRCTAVYEAYGPLQELEELACDCGCALGIVRYLSEPEQDSLGVSLVRLAA